ncbi:HK97 gp10 family phage protein [Actinoplanes sp. CA-142083]|uniref:HK97 gp10 family phage protein n=1 Tax=Actinoplanes sp. CA-142083 TaxID=3239903 RepID=UPI003D8DF908
MVDSKIQIEDLNKIGRALRAVDKEAPKGLRIALNSGADLLVEHTRPKIPSRSGAARRSLVARSTRTSARVAVGGKKAPWFPWLDFGGEGRIKGRPAAREFIKEGRYVYPTLAEIRPKIETQLQGALSAVISSAGLVED